MAETREQALEAVVLTELRRFQWGTFTPLEERVAAMERALALPAGAASPPGDAKEAAATLTGHPVACVCGVCLVAAASWTAGREAAAFRAPDAVCAAHGDPGCVLCCGPVADLAAERRAGLLEAAQVATDAAHEFDERDARFVWGAASGALEVAQRIRALATAPPPPGTAPPGTCVACGRGPGIATTLEGLCKYCYCARRDAAPAAVPAKDTPRPAPDVNCACGKYTLNTGWGGVRNPGDDRWHRRKGVEGCDPAVAAPQDTPGGTGTAPEGGE